MTSIDKTSDDLLGEIDELFELSISLNIGLISGLENLFPIEPIRGFSFACGFDDEGFE